MLTEPRLQPPSACREAFVRARHTARPVLASWTRPIAAREAIAFFAQNDRLSDRALWLQPASGRALVGLGVACELTGAGNQRFREVARNWQALVADAVVEPGPAGLGPVLLGGFSFDPLRTGSGLWAGFPDGRMVLPERMLTIGQGGTWLTTNTLVQPGGDEPASVTDAARQPLRAERPLAEGLWKTLVSTLARGIRERQLGVDKVVLARAEQVRQPSPIDLPAALRRLADAYPSCTVFAVGRSDACFIGATPEQLVTLRAGQASTMALAGSRQRGASPAEDMALAECLVSDPKERAEHALVVDALREGLARDGLCRRVVADGVPRVNKLANVQHLLTAVRGQVAPGTSVVDLVERLHPTPAVGGRPRRQALELIRAYEALDRGWYAGPIGWVDQHGQGEFVVGIRAALVRGATATLFAGCGIVAGSNAEAEYAESSWKLRPMLAALGVEA